jgi:hypothetical protein
MKFDHLLRNMKAKVEPNDENEESRVNSLELNNLSEVVEPVEILGSRVKSEESNSEDADPGLAVETKKSRVNTLESSVMSIDSTVMMEAIREANRKPKLGVYSPLAAAILRYKAITIPRYSMGAELRTIIEKALKETYPDLYEEVQRKINSEQP